MFFLISLFYIVNPSLLFSLLLATLFALSLPSELKARTNRISEVQLMEIVDKYEPKAVVSPEIGCFWSRLLKFDGYYQANNFKWSSNVFLKENDVTYKNKVIN